MRLPIQGAQHAARLAEPGYTMAATAKQSAISTIRPSHECLAGNWAIVCCEMMTDQNPGRLSPRTFWIASNLAGPWERVGTSQPPSSDSFQA